MNIQYYFKLGLVESNTKPSSPTLTNLMNWYTDFKTHSSSKDYVPYLVGSFAEKEFGSYDGRPYDVDVVLIGNIKDEASLKSLLEFSIERGFANDIMIDIWHNDKLMDLTKDVSITQTRSYGTYIGSITINGNNVTDTIQLWNGDGTELPSGLWQYVYSNGQGRSWNKANGRLLDGKYKAIQKKIADIITTK